MKKNYVKGPYDTTPLSTPQKRVVYKEFVEYYSAKHGDRKIQADIVDWLNDKFGCFKSLRSYRRIYNELYLAAAKASSIRTRKNKVK